jgi:curved DNA-binding protein CbpA
MANDGGMQETFYTALGIDADAGTETVERAYRDRIKETHPDVSDDPGAAEEFKRLTTARDVLVDRSERKRYDRLGHRKYVREQVTHSGWAVEGVADAGGGAQPTTNRTETADRTTTGQQTAAGNDPTGTWDTNTHGQTDRSTGRGKRAETGRSRSRSRPDGGYGNAGWQTASDAYRRTDMNVESDDPSSVESALHVANSLGSWVFIHLAVIVSAVATAWFFYTTSLHAQVSLAALVGATILVVLVLALSTLHVLLQVYATA